MASVNNKKKQQIINKIVKKILIDQFFAEDWQDRLVHLKEIYIGDAKIDRAILKAGIIKYFKNKSILELETYYKNIAIRSKSHLSVATERVFNRFIKLSKRLFQAANVNNIRVNSKYSTWFDKFGYEGKGLYRKALQAGYTNLQQVDVLLNKMLKSGWCSRKDSQKLLEFLEKELLSAHKTLGLLEEVSIVARVSNNLCVALQNIQTDFNNKAIHNVRVAIKSSVLKINEYKTFLLSGDWSTLEKQKIYQAMQYERIKLLHFIAKSDALGKGEIFSVIEEKRGISFQDYMQKQLITFMLMDELETVLPNYYEMQPQTKNLFRTFTEGYRSKQPVELDQFIKDVNKQIIKGNRVIFTPRKISI